MKRDPTEDEIQSRKDGMYLAHKAAMRGDKIAGGLFSLISAAHETGLGYMATTAQDYADWDDDEDIRPF